MTDGGPRLPLTSVVTSTAGFRDSKTAGFGGEDVFGSVTERHPLDSALTSASDVKVHAPEDASNHGIKKYSTYFIEENMYFGSVSERHPLDIVHLQLPHTLTRSITAKALFLLCLLSKVVFSLKVLTNQNIDDAVEDWIDNPDDAVAMYGNITKWNTTEVTSMSTLFEERATFNDAISGWDVSSVIYMNRMFLGASAFNRDISG